MINNNYWARFDNNGRVGAILLDGVHVKTDAQREKLSNDGYIPISDEDYQHYIGNRDAGDNGTGYIRDTKTGKPVSAPPAPPVETTETPTADVPETEIAVMEGMVDLQSRIAALEEEITRLKGGNGQ